MTAAVERGPGGHWYNPDGQIVWHADITASDARKAITDERRAFWELARTMDGNPHAIGTLAMTALRVTDELQDIIRALKAERG